MATVAALEEASGPRRPGAAALLLRHPGAIAGGGLVLAFVLTALLAPVLAPYDPIASDWGAIRSAPSIAHPFGTDDLGRDVLSRVIWGARASLLAGVISVLIAVAIGVPAGLLAGYFGGWPDLLIARCTDALLACPFLILAIAFGAFLGPSLENAMIAIGVSATPVFVRLARGQTLNVKAEDYVEGARAIGASHARILLVHVLPNVTPPILVQATLTLALAIVAEASLAFLGLGQRPPAPSWGSMLDVARQFLTQAPWMAVWPGLAICLAVLGFNLLGDALRDALDPRERP